MGIKKQEISDVEKRRDQLQKKYEKLQEFSKNVDKKREDLFRAASELSALKDAIPERNELPTLMNVLVTEAKRVGLTVKGINPQIEVRKDFFIEQPVKLEVSGAYFQLLAFTERLMSVNQVIQVASLDLSLSQENSAIRKVLVAKMDVKFFKYLGTQADTLGRQESTAPSGNSTSTSSSGSNSQGVRR